MTLQQTIVTVVVVALVVGGAVDFLLWCGTHARLVSISKLPDPSAPVVEQFHPLTHDMTPHGLLAYYSVKTVEAMASANRPAHVYARMAASLAFSLYPDLRPHPVVVMLFPKRTTSQEARVH